jgi:SAM-dependent methyltransferase
MNDAPNLFSDGKAYEQMMGRWSQVAGKTFLDWLGLPKGLSWLDVGCGNGAFTETLIAQSAPAAVTGVDPSEGQLAYARTRPGTKLAQFRVAGAQALPFDDKTFDAAVMPLVISFVPDPVQAVAEMKRVVKPGGWLGAYMWDVPGGGLPLEPVQAALRELGAVGGYPPGYLASTEAAMRDAWEANALQAIETRVIRIRVSYPDFDDFWTTNSVPVGPGGMAIAKLALAEKEKLKALLRERLPRASDGSISYEPFANAVKGRVPG